jgi:hypothetical protein
LQYFYCCNVAANLTYCFGVVMQELNMVEVELVGGGVRVTENQCIGAFSFLGGIAGGIATGTATWGLGTTGGWGVGFAGGAALGMMVCSSMVP